MGVLGRVAGFVPHEKIRGGAAVAKRTRLFGMGAGERHPALRQPFAVCPKAAVLVERISRSSSPSAVGRSPGTLGNRACQGAGATSGAKLQARANGPRSLAGCVWGLSPAEAAAGLTPTA